MLSFIKTTLTYGNRKYLPNWNKYISYLLFKSQHIQYAHFNAYGSSTGGNNLLSYILAMLDLPYINRHKDDYYLYMNYISTIENDFDAIFSYNSTNKIFNNMFISKNSKNTQEYILPVNAGNYIKLLPFNKPFNDWTHLRALRLLEHDSDEYTINLTTDQIIFKYNPPTFVVFTIDPIILAFQYKHFLYEANVLNENRNTLYFIHKYVLNPIFIDLINAWLLKQLFNIFTFPYIKDIPLNNYDVSKGNIRQGFNEAIWEIYLEKNKLKTGTIKPNDLLMSNMLIYDTSILDRITMLTEDTIISNLQQYMHYQYLKDRSLIKLIIMLYSLINTKSYATYIVTKLSQKINRMINMQIWNYVDRNTKAIIHNELINLYTLLQK